jgi:hypothetical protein
MAAGVKILMRAVIACGGYFGAVLPSLADMVVPSFFFASGSF